MDCSYCRTPSEMKYISSTVIEQTGKSRYLYQCQSCGKHKLVSEEVHNALEFEEEVLEPSKLESVTIGVARRCPTCGEFPEDFRQSFTRRVDENYIIPEKSRTYSESGGKVFCIEDHYAKMQHKFPDEDFSPPDRSPEGLCASVIVPRNLVGKVIRIKVEEAKDADTSPENQDTQEG